MPAIFMLLFASSGLGTGNWLVVNSFFSSCVSLDSDLVSNNNVGNMQQAGRWKLGWNIT